MTWAEGTVRMECEFNQYVKEYVIYNAVNEEVLRTAIRNDALEVWKTLLNSI